MMLGSLHQTRTLWIFKLGGSELGHYQEMGDIVDALNASENQQSSAA